MEPSLQPLIFILIQVFLLVGLVGLIVPLFPGMLVMWLALLVYGFLTGWGTLGIVLFVLITILAVGGSLADNVMMAGGALKGGAAWTTIAIAVAAGLLGTIFLPPLGGLIAAPGSVLLLEYRRSRDWGQAWAALRGLAAGWGLAFVVRFVVGLLMIGLWWIWVWRG